MSPEDEDHQSEEFVRVWQEAQTELDEQLQRAKAYQLHLGNLSKIPRHQTSNADPTIQQASYIFKAGIGALVGGLLVTTACAHISNWFTWAGLIGGPSGVLIFTTQNLIATIRNNRWSQRATKEWDDYQTIRPKSSESIPRVRLPSM